MTPHSTERSGEGRRVQDVHCGAHEQNTTDIAGQKSAMMTLKWVIGITLPVGLLLISWFQVQYSDSLKSINAHIQVIQTSTTANALSNALIKQELGQIKDDVQDIKVRGSFPAGGRIK